MNLLITKKTIFSGFILVIFFGSVVDAQIVGNRTSVYDISADNLQNKIDYFNENQNVESAQKKRILGLYQQADENIRNLQWFQFLINTFQTAMANGSAKLKQLDTEIDRVKIQLKLRSRENLKAISLERLDLQLLEEKSSLRQIEDAIRRLEADISEQKSRPDVIRKETQQVLQDTANNGIRAPQSLDDNISTLEKEAAWFYKKTKKQSENAHLEMLDAEIASYPVRMDLLKAQLQLERLRKKLLLPKIISIDEWINAQRQIEHELTLETLALQEIEASIKHPSIRLITRENYNYNKQLQQVSKNIKFYEKSKDKIDKLGLAIEKDFKSAEKKIDLAGLSPALGRILRDQRRNLANSGVYVDLSKQLHDEIREVSLDLFRLEERSKQLFDIQLEIERLINDENSQLQADAQLSEIKFDLEVLLEDQKKSIDKLITDNSHLLRSLGDYDFSISQYLKHSEKYTEYLDQRLLWVQSSSPYNFNTLEKLIVSFQWLVSPKNWLEVQSSLVVNISKYYLITLFALLVMCAFLIIRRKIYLALNVIAGKVSKLYCDGFDLTLQALAYNLILALPLPVLLVYFGWMIKVDVPLGGFSFSVGHGLIKASVALFFLQLFCLLFSNKGVFRLHFQWPEKAVKLVRQQIYWIRIIAVPNIFLINMTSSFINVFYSDVLGRAALISTLIVMSIALAKVLNPNGALLNNFTDDIQNSWIYKLRYLWYPAIVLIPLGVVMFAVFGYYLSALELQQKLIITLRFMFNILISHQLLIRWLTLVNRQIALQNAGKKRKANEKTSGYVESTTDDSNKVEEELVDIPKINAQTIQVLNMLVVFVFVIGIVFIWQNILPAFTFLNDIVLWQRLILIEDQQVLQSTTLLNVGLAVLYIFLAIMVIRNLSGLMEIFIFRHFSMQSGGRYATIQITQYTLVTVMFFCIAGELGGSWGQVQWLIAALGVGLGFGLQEIFANLVSGLILLFERPIRIGDTVTIGDVTGDVSRIEMRATTIVDWDQKELIVPNKTFVTNQLVNWTLTNSVTRIVIPVGVAYGTDVDKVHKILLQTVKTTDAVLSEPAPSVLFLGFGDSSLDFSVRVYVAELAQRLAVMHSLHMNISCVFKEQGIEIPFPQRDIHIRSQV